MKHFDYVDRVRGESTPMENEPLYTEDYISELIQSYSDMVLRIAFAYLKNSADAQDVCQEVFIKIVKQQKTSKHAEHDQR
ncbi:sigma-70-like protein [Paenibacillus prosopidis]|uniref:Sigma-70-like protein n=2 Tax=Paenibacillus prosopidis TaxID=630520 RepID=A0A368VNF5_9BACL|nr:sigma-70-like protein [Paenibacillus prosopidis]